MGVTGWVRRHAALSAVGALIMPLTGALADIHGPVPIAAWSMPSLLLVALLAAHPALRPFSRAR